MTTVHVGVGHYDYLVVTQLAYVKILAYSGAQSCDYRRQLVIVVYLVRPGFFHVQHLAPKREYGLKPAVPALLGGTSRGVPLHDVYFRQSGVPLVTVGKFSRKGAALQGVLAADVFPGLSCGLPCPAGSQGLIQYYFGNGGVFLQEYGQLFGDNIVHKGAHFGVAQLGFGLPLKLGVHKLYGYDGHQALTAVLARDFVPFFQEAGFLAVGINCSCQGRFKPRFVHAAFGGVYVVGKGEDCLVIAVVILQGYLHLGIIPAAVHVYDLVVEDGLVLVYPGDKFPDAALVMHFVPLLPAGPPVLGGYAKSGIQESLFPHAGMEYIILELYAVKNLRIGLETDNRAGPVRIPSYGKGLGYFPP